MAKTTTSSAPKKSVKIAGLNYQHVSCAKSKATATRAAKAVREKEGRIARVIKNGSMFCVYKGRKRKASAVPAKKTSSSSRKK
jgi:hypothetical protein